jgi:phosphate transport system permease protein
MPETTLPDSTKTSALHTVAPIALRRRITNHVMTGVAVFTVVLVLVPLFAIFAYLVYRGIGSINWAFLTKTPRPVGEVGGGMSNAIVGSGVILALASLIGVPLGVGAGIYVAEYGRNRLGDVTRFTADVLNGVPSIVIGIVGYSIVVLAQGHFSALAGGVALAIMMIPTITRTTEEMLLLVPQALREAAYGLGIPRWRATLSITLRTATSGVITGIMLAFARVAGETAPLLFTSLGNQYWSLSTDLAHPWSFLWRHPVSFFWNHHLRLGLDQPTAALPLQIYTYALSPYDDWHRQAWAGAFVLIILIVTSVAAVRFAVRRGTFGAA